MALALILATLKKWLRQRASPKLKKRVPMKKKLFSTAVITHVFAALLMTSPITSNAAYQACSTVLGAGDIYADGQVDCLAASSRINDEGGAGNNVNDVNGNILFGGTEEWQQLPVYNDSSNNDASFLTESGSLVDADAGGFNDAGSFLIKASVFDLWDEVMLYFKDGRHGATAIIISLDSMAANVSGWVDQFGSGLVAGTCNISPLGSCYAGDYRNVINGGGDDVISHANLWVRNSKEPPHREVPGPGTLGLFGLGLLGMGLVRRRRS